MNDMVVLIHGVIRMNPTLVDSAWEGFPIIWSTWKGQQLNTQHMTLFNDIPDNPGVGNLGLQSLSIYNGCVLAKQMGYKRVLKWRSDMFPTNAAKFVSLFDTKATNMLYWHNHQHGYYVDYFMEADVDDMLSVWDISELDNIPYAEYGLLSQIDKFNLNINCIGQHLDIENDIVWSDSTRQMVCLSTYRYDSLFLSKRI